MTLLCAFSGGPDSVFLALWLQKKYPEKSIVLAHFNHHLRGEESDEEERFAAQFAKENNMLFEKGEWKAPEMSEEKARNARYAFLEKARKKHDAQWICTGHHSDDNSETVLLQFLRGGGLLALSGIAEKLPKRHLWRPLLDVSKAEILQFLQDENIEYCIDSSNEKSDYTRNFLRNDIIPSLEEKFPNVSKRISAKTRYFYEVQEMLETQAVTFLYENSVEKGIQRELFLRQPFPVRCEIIKKIFPRVSWSEKKFGAIEDFLSDAKSGKRIEIKTGWIEVFGELFFCVQEEK